MFGNVIVDITISRRYFVYSQSQTAGWLTGSLAGWLTGWLERRGRGVKETLPALHTPFPHLFDLPSPQRIVRALRQKFPTLSMLSSSAFYHC